MSRGPGRMMRAALAQLAEWNKTEAFGVALRARHDTTHPPDCDGEGCTDGEVPSRAELVAARRALHTLARQGVVELYRKGDVYEGKPPYLCARLSVAYGSDLNRKQHLRRGAHA